MDGAAFSHHEDRTFLHVRPHKIRFQQQLNHKCLPYQLRAYETLQHFFLGKPKASSYMKGSLMPLVNSLVIYEYHHYLLKSERKL